jgi:hypothetical protein
MHFVTVRPKIARLLRDGSLVFGGLAGFLFAGGGAFWAAAAGLATWAALQVLAVLVESLVVWEHSPKSVPPEVREGDRTGAESN